MPECACRICGKPYDGTKHCSVNACRNCAMFFKRTKLFTKVPICRSGTDNCELKNIGNVKCTFCRYKKCLEEGMTLQTTRRSEKQGTNPITLRDSVDTLLVNEMTLIVPEAMSSLKHFCYYYAKYVMQQRKFEMDILQSEGVQLEETSANRLITRISQARCNGIYASNILFGFFDLLRPGFSSFSMMDSNEQFVILQKLLFPIFNFAAIFRSLRTFNGENNRKILITESMYLDLNDMNGFLDHKTFDPMDIKMIQNHFVVYWGRQLDSTLRFMRHMKITDVEFLIVFTLILWEERNFNGSEVFRVMAEKQRTLIMKDLHYYYKNILKLEDYVERVMNIMQLCRIIQENQQFEAESFRLLKTFNYYGDTQLKFIEKVIQVSEQ